VSNHLIVESKNDRAFIQALTRHINLEDSSILELESAKIDLCTDNFQILNGSDPSILEKALKTVIALLQPEDRGKIGIILDADKSITEKIDKINIALQKVFSQISNAFLTQTNELKEIIHESDLKIEVACLYTTSLLCKYKYVK
jgi:hypothetical protein